MSDVSVIGTGAMGSALVEGLAGSGAEVTVCFDTVDVETRGPSPSWPHPGRAWASGDADRDGSTQVLE